MDQVSSEQHDLTFDNWLPTLERAAQWNAWSEAELLQQLGGHLRGRAFQEWNLIEDEDHRDCSRAVKALKERLDPGLCTLATQEFRHTRQRESEQRQAELRRRQQYRRAEQAKNDTHPPPSTSQPTQASRGKGGQGKRSTTRPTRGPRVQFHQYVYGQSFTILSDDKLMYIFDEKKSVPLMASAQVQRWALTLGAYTY